MTNMQVNMKKIHIKFHRRNKSPQDLKPPICLESEGNP